MGRESQVIGFILIVFMKLLEKRKAPPKWSLLSLRKWSSVSLAELEVSGPENQRDGVFAADPWE